MFTNQNKTTNQYFFMNLALRQANLNIGNTSTNPSVGCVITKNNRILSVGCTSVNGRPHAETNAIYFSKEDISDANLYVTLEPCSHYGKTSPCINKIIQKKFKKVFFSIKDPDIRSFDKSSKILMRKGINVNIGLSASKIRDFYRSYLQFKKNELPFVTCKLAISKDFFTINKKKKWITNEYSRGRVHLMRSKHDCVLTSSQTVLKDNPLLNCRIKGLEKNSPARIILDNKLIIPLKAKIYKSAKKNKTVVFYNKTNKKKIKMLNKMKIKTIKVSLDHEQNLDLKQILLTTKLLGFSRIFLESGPKLSLNFMKNNLINDLVIFKSNHSLYKDGSGNIKKYLKNFIRDKKIIYEKVNLMNDKLDFYKIR